MALEFPASAFNPFGEELQWQSTRTAKRGTFAAVVLHGQTMSESAGPSRGTFAADAWTVMVDAEVGMIADIKAGDTLTRLDRFNKVLNVQQVARDAELGWILTCTANEGSPK